MLSADQSCYLHTRNCVSAAQPDPMALCDLLGGACILYLHWLHHAVLFHWRQARLPSWPQRRKATEPHVNPDANPWQDHLVDASD